MKQVVAMDKKHWNNKQQEFKIARQNNLQEQKQFANLQTTSTTSTTDNNDKQISSSSPEKTTQNLNPASNGVNNNNSNNNNINGLTTKPDPRIQSIANVLNQHSKQNQSKKGFLFDKKVAASQQQVDQGNSYLYAYNEFVTSASNLSSSQQFLDQANTSQISSGNLVVSQKAKQLENRTQNILSLPLPPPLTSQITSSTEAFHPFLQNQQQQPHQFNNKQQETQIESDEDDALSYILHQHNTNNNNYHQHLHHYHSHNNIQTQHPREFSSSSANSSHLHANLNLNSNLNLNLNQLGQVDKEEDNDQVDLASRIEHHLSCPRSSHPRHICGIGSGGKGQRLTNSNIGARLKEESQRAFVLNQRHRSPANSSKLLVNSYHYTATSVQSSLSPPSQQLCEREEIVERRATGSELNISNSPAISSSESSGDHQLANYQQNCLLEQARVSSKSQARREKLYRIRSNQQNQNKGYLSWLFCSICNLIGFSQDNKTTMYTSNNHQQHLAGLSGQAGAYFGGQQQQTDQYGNNVNVNNFHHQHQNQQQHLSRHHHHHQQHHQHYPAVSSDSSLGSSGPFASRRLSGLFKQCCCSKKCLFVTCIMLILMIFILVIGLSAYLNFLINLNKVHLSPLSGRLKVDSQGDQFNELLLNKTSKEFLAKQQQYETILRGAFDRTQSLLKSYPNHLVKLEVYSFKPGSLWIYFRLFINKKSLMLDNSLMKRKSPDEQLDKQFLPRLTQQTLHSGFEQLISESSSSSSSGQPIIASTSNESGFSRSRNSRASSSTQSQLAQRAKEMQQNVKSFDEQISRLMPIIESIDLQSIQVTPEFDMLLTGSSFEASNSQPPPSMSDNLRGAPSQFLNPPITTTTTTTPSTILLANGNTLSKDNSKLTEYDLSSSTTPSSFESSSGRTSATELSPSGTTDEISVSTRKFTLYGYKENTTRPTVSSSSQNPLQSQQDSLFLTNLQQKKQASLSKPTQSEKLSSQTAKELANVVKLISGQPVISQNGPILLQNASVNQRLDNKTTTLFNQLPSNKLISVLEQAQQSPKDMIAPYQKNDFSSSSPQTSSPKSIQELWSSALSKKNVTMKNEQLVSNHSDQQPNKKRIVTVSSTIQGSSNGGHQSAAVLSSDVSETIRAQMLNQQQQPLQTTTTTTTTTPLTSTSSQKPKVSPHLRHGGSIISTPRHSAQEELLQTLSSPATPQTSTTSAIVLNRDFQLASIGAAAANNQGQQPQVSTGQQPVRLQSSSANNHNQTRSSSSSSVSSAKSNATLAVDSSSLSPNKQTTISSRKPSLRVSGNADKQRNVKPTIKKIKKTTSELSKNNGTTESLPQTTTQNAATAASTINSKGIRIVDNFLASKAAATEQHLLQLTKNKTQKEPSNFNNFNSDIAAPTLPTTIELIRSTTSMAPSQRDYLTTTEPPFTTTQKPLRVSPAVETASIVDLNLNQPINRPGTSSFSNQWRPISNLIVSENNRSASIAPLNSTRKQPNVSIILGTERFPGTLNVQGSQSPFAMSTAAILEGGPLKPIAKPISRSPRLNNKQSNTYQIISSTSNTRSGSSAAGNEFESRRVSRMQQNRNVESTAAATETSSSSSFTTSSTTSTTSATSTSHNTNSMDPNTRLVDDFVITGDKIAETNTRLLAPLVLSTMHEIDPIAQIRAANPVVSVPKRTRGPFAFDTIKSELSDIETSSRLERSPSASAESKLLLRKKLFLGDDNNESEPVTSGTIDIPKIIVENQPINLTNVASSEHNSMQANDDIIPPLDQFGNRRHTTLQSQSTRSIAPSSSVLSESINTENSFTDVQFNSFINNTFRCQYYGCKSKGTLKFTCLDHSQLCDDSIDCEDESDELDCVSLLQHDSNSNRLSFSNGAGIVYLNRKGSLAPMCVDYFVQQTSPIGTNSPHQLDAMNLSLMRKQQELVRQINTIGQYACSLQSFSRLVSVKINHHNLVDTMGLIKSSRLFHKLSIIGDLESEKLRPLSSDPSYSSYKSATSEHEVEISTSIDCPSQRTVFVKCGGFECGQDSFSVINQQNNNSKKAGVVINDFPWLVKLYWLGTLSCHGYLIDDLWLITSSECFLNKTTTIKTDTDNTGWSAQVSYEHYGNDDYTSIESNRRNIKEIQTTSKSPIVLAKLEKPVRFSPLNRPICLPWSSSKLNNNNNNNNSSTSDLNQKYSNCVTATLPLNKQPTQLQQPQQAHQSNSLLLNKVKVHKSPIDCLRQQEDQSNLEVNFTTHDSICVSESLSTIQSGQDLSRIDTTHVLICATIQASRSRSRWTVVGVENKSLNLKLEPNKHLFTSVSSQIDWIVDTMDPKPSSSQTVAFSGDGSLQSTSNRFRCSSGELISFSRLCDSIYDCSSQDDERDCHK